MTAGNTVIFLGTFPPPNHGMAIATASLADALEGLGVPILRVDTMREGRFGRAAKWQKLKTILAATMRAAARPAPVLVIGADAGLGLGLQALPAIAMQLRRHPVFVIHHSVVVPRASSHTARMFARATRSGVTHVFQCERLSDEFHRSHPNSRSRTMVVSNGHVLAKLIESGGTHKPPRPASARLGTPAEPIRVGHLSNLDVSKGFGVVGDAVHSLTGRGYSIRYVLAGVASNDEASAELVRLRRLLGDQLEELGFLTGESKRLALTGLDVFAHPSTYVNECYTISVWEALAVGTPIVSVDAGCLNSEAVGEGGVVLDRSGPEEVADAITSILEGGEQIRLAAFRSAQADYLSAKKELGELARRIQAFM